VLPIRAADTRCRYALPMRAVHIRPHYPPQLLSAQASGGGGRVPTTAQSADGGVKVRGAGLNVPRGGGAANPGAFGGRGGGGGGGCPIGLKQVCDELDKVRG
jgi:hypothetical protein